MFSFDYSFLNNSVRSHKLSEQVVMRYESKIHKFLKRIDTWEQGFADIVDDTSMIKELSRFAKKVEGKYKHIVLLGIGGSALGPRTIADTLGHSFANERRRTKRPSFHVLDNVDPFLIRDVLDVVDLKATLFLVVTKSGGTAETLSQYMFFRKSLEEAKLPVNKHMVFITDPKKGMLRAIATKEKIPAFAVPENIGGRFSVLSPVGLLPAALLGFDIASLLDGAREMRDRYLSKDVYQNLPFQLATLQYLAYKRGKTQHVLFPYASKLRTLGDWYAQLLAESIGKARTRRGRKVHVGPTPVTAMGATDQHSQLQLFKEGPKDKLFLFMEVDDMGPELPIPMLHEKRKEVSYLKDVSFEELLKTEKFGTMESLSETGLPSISIDIPGLSERTLGGLFFLFEGATAFLGEYFKINAFDQPGVERSKEITKAILTQVGHGK